MGYLATLHDELSQEVPAETAFTRFARGGCRYEEYVDELKGQLRQQGGGWVTVAPRDTVQQGNDSESAAITSLSRLAAEVWAQKAGCIGYEIGGAQYQAGLIRGFDPATILLLGLPFNMPAHSLQRAQYVNGLAELTPDIRSGLFNATAQMVTSFYRQGESSQLVPWHPYNFHAGNYVDEATGYSPQDSTTSELLQAGCVPIPCWVFSAKFPLPALKKWTARQIDLFASQGRTLQQVRIKNPGQGIDWTPEAVWSNVKTMLDVFEERDLPQPVVYIHNHDFNGKGGHIGAEVLRMAQKAGFPYLVIDAAYRKNGTHNDNTIVQSALNLSPEQQDALGQYNHVQQQIEKVLIRFDGRTSQMTPFSEYKLRLGIAILIEPGIEPKTAEKVRAWVNGGGKLKVGGDVLIGLKRWETLVPKTPEVDKLLSNMSAELQGALDSQGKLIGPGDLPGHFTPAQVHTALGYQQKGLDFIKSQARGTDLTPLLVAPHVLHRKPRTLPSSTRFELLYGSDDGTPNVAQRAVVDFTGFGTAPI